MSIDIKRGSNLHSMLVAISCKREQNKGCVSFSLKTACGRATCISVLHFVAVWTHTAMSAKHIATRGNGKSETCPRTDLIDHCPSGDTNGSVPKNSHRPKRRRRAHKICKKVRHFCAQFSAPAMAETTMTPASFLLNWLSIHQTLMESKKSTTPN